MVEGIVPTRVHVECVISYYMADRVGEMGLSRISLEALRPVEDLAFVKFQDLIVTPNVRGFWSYLT